MLTQVQTSSSSSVRRGNGSKSLLSRHRALARRTAALTAAVTFAAFGASSAMAQLYWDTNGSTAGLGGTGSWDNSNANLVWNTDSTGGNGGTVQGWTAGSDAIFSGSGTGTVTVAATVLANSLQFNNTATQGYNFLNGGGTIVLNGGGGFPSINGSGTIDFSQAAGTGNITFSSVISGNSDISFWKNNTSTNGTFVFFNAANTFTGNLNLRNSAPGTGINQGISRIEFANAGALPATATVNFVDDAAGISWGIAGIASVNVPNNIVIGPLGSFGNRAFIGANTNNFITLGGTISGGDPTAMLAFQRNTGGGPGVIVLNAASTYQGYTMFNTGSATTTLAGSNSGTARGWVQWGVNNALPTTTSMVVGTPISGTTFGTGAIDLAGHNQTVAGLATGLGNNGPSQGITNSASATTLSTLTIANGSGVSIYKSTIGTPQLGSNKDTNGNDVGFGGNVALVLAGSFTGVLDLQSQNTTNSSDYFGGTTVSSGTLLVNNNNGSGTGTGPVTVASAGTFGGGGSANGAVTINGGALRPGDTVVNTNTSSLANSFNGTMTSVAGTLTLRGGLTLNGPTQSYFDFDGTTRDTVATTGGTGSASLAVTGGAGSNVVNLNFQSGKPVINGVFPLFSYTGTQLPGGDFGTFSIGTNNIPQGTATLVNNAGEVDVQIAGNIDALIWKGTGTGSGTWDTATNNWTASNVPASYADGKYVLFDDSANGSGTLTVTINNGGLGNMQPLSTAFNNSTAKTYVFNGTAASDGIGGTGTLQKTGTGTVTFNTTNSYTGDTSIGGGTLALGATGKLTGTQNISIGGGSANSALTIASGGSISATTVNVNSLGTLSVAAANAITSISTLNLGGGTFKVTGTNTTFANNPQINSSSTVDIGANNVTFSGSFGGATNNGRDNMVTLVGGGTLTLNTPSLYWGGWNINAGTVIVNSVSGPGGWTGLGPGSNSNFNVNSVHVTNATLRLANVNSGDVTTPNNSPEIFLGNGAVLSGTGSSSVAREDFDVLLDTSTATKSITFNAPSAGDTLAIKGEVTSTDVANNFGGFGGGLSGTTVHKTGSGTVLLQSGLPTSISSTILPANTFRAPAVTWQVDAGMLQIGPVVASSYDPNDSGAYKGPFGEPLNALGYQALDGTTLASAQTGDPEKASPVFVNTGGTLALAVDAPNTNSNKLPGNEPPNPTPNYLRSPVNLNGGALAATGFEVSYDTNNGSAVLEGNASTTLVTAHFGGDFNVANTAGGSKILTYNPANTSEARQVQLVGGSRTLANQTPFYAAGTTVFYALDWNGNLEVNSGASVGGSFDILRDAVGSPSGQSTSAGSVFVNSNNPTITVTSNAVMNLKGNLDALHDSVNNRNVNIVNNGTMNAAVTAVGNSNSVIAGTKNIGTLSGSGVTNVLSPSSLQINETSATNYTGTFGGTGGLIKAGNATLGLTNLRYNGQVTISAGTVHILPSGLSATSTSVLASAPVITGTGQLDLEDNAMIINYAASDNTHSVRNTIRNLLVNGRNGAAGQPGAWNGLGGITSSFANANGNGFNLAVGYGDNEDIALVRGSGSYTAFGGQTVASNTVLVQMTRGADATLDGVVDAQDVTILGSHFNKPNSGQWVFGDFDYSGTCDATDVTTLGSTFGKTSPTLSPAQMTAEFGAAFTQAFEGGQAGAVPEPASLTLLGLGGLALIGRRNRKRRNA